MVLPEEGRCKDIMPQPSRVTVLVVLLLSLGMAYYHLFLLRPSILAHEASLGLGNGFYFGADLYPLWLTSRQVLLQRQAPYSPEMTRQIQTGLFGRPLDPRNRGDRPVNYRTFAYPAYTLLFLAPLVRLPFEYVRLCAAVVLAGAVVGSVFLWVQAVGLKLSTGRTLLVVLLALANYYVLEGLYAEQMGLLVGLLLAGAVVATRSEKLRCAGVLLALATIKPQMCVLLTAGILLWTVSRWKERRSLTISFLSSIVLLGLVGEWLHGGWFREWQEVVRGYRGYASLPLTELVFGVWFGLLLSSVLWAATLALWWRFRQSEPRSLHLVFVAAITLAVTAVSVLPGQAFHDHVIVMPGVLLLAASWRKALARSYPMKIALVLTGSLLLWQWVTALVVALSAFVASEARIRGSVFALHLPLQTVILFPFALLATLWFAGAYLAEPLGETGR
jgi:hypothetical protein